MTIYERIKGSKRDKCIRNNRGGNNLLTKEATEEKHHYPISHPSNILSVKKLWHNKVFRQFVATTRKNDRIFSACVIFIEIL